MYRLLQFLLSVFVVLTWSADAPSAPQIPNIALMPFQVDGADPAYATALMEKMKSELTSSGAFRVLERQRMDEILQEQGFQQTGACDASGCLVEAGRLLGVDKMLSGTLSKAGTTFVVAISLVDVESGQISASVNCTVPGSSDSLFQNAPSQLVHKLRLATDPRYVQATDSALAASNLAAKQAALDAQKRTQTIHQHIAWGFSGLALVSLGSAVYFHTNAQSMHDQANKDFAQYQNATTTTQSVYWHQQTKDHLDKGNRSIILRNSLGALGLLSLGTAFYFFF